MGKGKKEDGGMGCEGEGKIGMRERGGELRKECARGARVQVGFMLACVARSVHAGGAGGRGKRVLVDNVSIPTFVLTLSHAKICPANVLHMS